MEGVEEGRFALASTRRIPQHRSTRTPGPALAPSPLGNPIQPSYTSNQVATPCPIPLTCWRPSPPARCTCTQTAAPAPAVTPRSAKEMGVGGMMRCGGEPPYNEQWRGASI